MKNILKKIGIICLAFIICLSSLLFIGNVHKNSVVHAGNENNLINEAELKDTFQNVLTSFVAVSEDRTAGSEGEKLAAQYIYNILNQIGLEPVSLSSSGTEGIQSFKFSSTIDGLGHTSQNVVFKISAKEETEKTVILGSNYDSLAYDNSFNVVTTEGVNGSAGSVAMMLVLATYLSEQALDYNVIFAFFGAGESDSAGSKIFTDGLTDKMQENILLMINFDKIALGENLYFYVDEVKTSLTTLAENLSVDKTIGVGKIDISHLGKINLSGENELGLTYTHIAQSQNVINFMKLGVLSMNVFAGDYSSGIVIGRREFSGEDLVTYTSNDSLSYIANTYGLSALTANLVSVFNFVETLLFDDGFVSACEASLGQTKSFYAFFGNYNLILYLTICVFVILVIVAAFVYYKLFVRSLNSELEAELAKTIISISNNIGEIPEEDKSEIPKAVGQIIARDLKKPKKSRKRKDDKNK